MPTVQGDVLAITANSIVRMIASPTIGPRGTNELSDPVGFDSPFDEALVGLRPSSARRQSGLSIAEAHYIRDRNAKFKNLTPEPGPWSLSAFQVRRGGR
jgi:hypothetical protein